VLLEEARWATASLLLMAGFLFFMLASGDTFLSKLVKVIPRFRDKKRAVAIVHEVQEDIAVYMLAITLINAGMGAAVGGVMLALGVPNAALWGVMATLLNYIPYVGAIVGVGVVALVSLATFDSVGYALLAPLTYTVLTSVEANVVTPLILGKRLRLNPLVLFAAVIFWGWVWGVPGAFVAVPITVAMRIIFDRVEQLRPLAEFFGR
jgi:predicted PurR-regulated permease PerM